MVKPSENIDPHLLSTSKDKVLWAIDSMTTNANDRFTAAQITEFLVEKVNLNIARQTVWSAAEKLKKLLHKNGKGHKLMAAGQKELEKLVNRTDDTIVIHANKPFSARHVVLSDIFTKMTQTVCICDPYVDVRTLELVYNYLKHVSVKILTSNIKDKPSGSFAASLNDLRKEGYNIEVGHYTNSTLHDRYMFDDQVFWLSGNSLNGIGAKESFLVQLGVDIHQSMRETFDRRWKVANKV